MAGNQQPAATDGILGLAHIAVGRPVGGLGAFVDRVRLLHFCKPATPEFDEAQSTGRAARFIIRTKDGFPIMVFCLYLAADADRDEGKAAISQAVMEAVELEWVATGVQDILMVGDFNAEVDTVPALAALLERQAVLDVWERLGPEGDRGATCFAKGLVGAGKRRDWILASPAVFARVKAVRVREGAGYDTHKPVQVLLGPTGAVPPRSILVNPRPFAEQVAERFGDDCGPVHDCITARLAEVVVQLGACRDRRDANGLWRTWSRAVEAGVIDALALPAAEAKAYRGRGAPTLRALRVPSYSYKQLVDRDGVEDSAAEVFEAVRKLRLMEHLAAFVQKHKVVPGSQAATAIASEWGKVRAAPEAYVVEEGWAARVAGGGVAWPAAVVKLKLAVNHLAKAHAAQVKEQIRARAAARREKMASRGGLTSCYKMLRSKPAPSLSVLCEGGRIIADEHELDGRMRQTWHHIFHGDQEGTEHDIAARAYCKYKEYHYQGPEAKIPTLTAARLREVALGSQPTAAGVDGWSPAEFKLLPLCAF